MDKQQTRQG
ncbi:hypothetical protein YPPY54_4494, partial [Yersinia pestis PY-54]